MVTEAELKAAARRYNTRVRALEAAEAERDATIRKASDAGISGRRIAAIFGLSHQRVHQIVRSQRV